MATLLEQGIAAAKNGDKTTARKLFEQVIQADDKNERAWLWLSEVANSNIERLVYVERALAINPNNKTTQLALKRLKAQDAAPPLPQPAVAAATMPGSMTQTMPTVSSEVISTAAAAPAQPTTARKPFLLQAQNNNLNRQPTMAMQGVGANNANIAAAPAVTEESLVDTFRATVGNINFANTPPDPEALQAYNLEKMPLIPLLTFGTLFFTAIGGLFLLVIWGLFV